MSFFADEKEPEMQIGYPTDVKHVAHIGWDGPSADSPSWVYCIHFPSFLPPQFIHCYEQNQFKVFATSCPVRDSPSGELNRHEKHAVNPDVLGFIYYTSYRIYVSFRDIPCTMSGCHTSLIKTRVSLPCFINNQA